MSVRQYIGARYVPKFYENSDGTTEWRSGVIYEPLTIVSYNGNSYTSKKYVPAEIGNPSANMAYWAATGLYNEQVESLREQVEELVEEYNNTEREVICLSQNPTNNPCGSCTVLKYSNHAFLIDLGLYLNYTENRDKLYSYGIDTIDGILITHYHGDHDGNPYTYADYSRYADDFDMTGCVFYLPLDPPTGVSAWESTTKTKLQAAFPNNTFNFPPYANIDFYGVKIEAFNNTQSDYDYYIANNVTDYNQYSQMVRCSYKSSSIIVMGDAGIDAQNYQYSLGKFKPTNIYCLPHHGVDGPENIDMLRRICPQYMYVSNAYNSNVSMRDYALAYADRNNVNVFDAVSSYPLDAVGSFNYGNFLCGNSKSYNTYAGYGHNVIHFDNNFPATAYQDGSETHPFHSLRRAICACKRGAYNEIVMHSDVTDESGAIQITADNGYIWFKGNGNRNANTVVSCAYGAKCSIERLTDMPNVQSLYGSSVALYSCGTVANILVWESEFRCDNTTVTSGGYRNSFLSVSNIVHTGTGSL